MSSKDPLISVIVPVYNVEKYLQKCVDSLLSQTYQNLEIILVDDGSPDNCPHLCDEYAGKNKNIISLHKTNGGLGSARNFGVEHARGEWIAFVDSDDYVLPNYIEDMWQLQLEYSADLISCDITEVDEQGNVLKKPPQHKSYCVSGEGAFSEIYFYAKSGWRSYSKLLKREMVSKHPFPDGYFEDFATTYKYFGDCDKVVIGNCGENYRYLQREGSILNSKLTGKHLYAFNICNEIADYIGEKYPEYAKNVYILYLRQVIQILNRQSMSKEEFDFIFKKYLTVFRKNLLLSLKDKRLNYKTKVYMILLCTSPKIYKGLEYLRR